MHLVKAFKRDLTIAAADLSRGDQSEFHCMIANRDPRDVLPLCLDETTMAIKVGALVLAVGGHKDGIIWFVTTNVVETLGTAERFRFYRILKGHYRSLKGTQNFQYSNVVSIDNHSHIRLLQSLGATFAAHSVMSPAGFQFKQFWL